ncbi:MAG: sulfate adenylyltransferase, partial [Verrucomicrobiota bacterium]
VVCVNKMDLVDFKEEVFEEIKEDINEFSTHIQVRDVTIIPISALKGDNVVERSTNMDWYQGTTLLAHLEEVHITNDRNLHDPRFPVQYVIRPQTDEHHDFRGYAGQISGGTFKQGDAVKVLPSGKTSKIKEIWTYDGALDVAFTPMSVTIRLEDEINVQRGSVIVRDDNVPYVDQKLDAMICWMHEDSMKLNKKYIVKQTSQTTRCMVKNLQFRVDIQTMERDSEASELHLNEIGRVSIMLMKPLVFDAYSRSRQTGSIIIIDEATNLTVGAGLICEPKKAAPQPEMEDYAI